MSAQPSKDKPLPERIEEIIKRYEEEVEKHMEEFHKKMEEIRLNTVKEIEEAIRKLEARGEVKQG